MGKKIIVFSFLICSFIPSVPLFGKGLSVGIGYFGEMIAHPGFSVFAEWEFLSGEHEALLLRGVAGFYNHPDYSLNLFLTPELAVRTMRLSPVYFQAGIGAGWLYQWPDADIVEYDGFGYSEASGGYHYFMPSVSLKGGAEISISKSRSMVLGCGLTGFWQYPFNNQWLVHPAFNLDFQIPVGGSE